MSEILLDRGSYQQTECPKKDQLNYNLAITITQKMVEWIAILVVLVCMSGSSVSRNWVRYDDYDAESWERDEDNVGPSSKFKYYGRQVASEENYEDYNDSGYDHGYGHDAHTQGYHNDREAHALGYDRHNHHPYGDHGYKNHWGHGHSQLGYSGPAGGHPHPSHGHPDKTNGHHHQHWGPYQNWGTLGHASQPGQNGPRGSPQGNITPPQRSPNDADRVVFPDFNNQVPTTRSPRPTRPVTTSTTTARTTTTDRTLIDLVICIRACPVTAEYNPVCGTNNVTYNNPGALQCARNCGLNVGIARQSPCPRFVPRVLQPSSTARPNTNPTTKAPVSQTTGATVTTTVRPAAPTVNPTRFTNINVNFNRPRPTPIPLDVLQSVFGNAPQSTNNNDELEFDIDKRMNP
ncbi:uncharacterized protein LOC125229502 [Leguminivora glycinivorella]|uniref:uncharacterized protein LOC125229502 n=1 Tax=Leguminivora glycinivorella TaxID=1035111 RepID=UPI00200D8FEF|nr:uncharacterized protein LOC125229502 [Leguminivora glycinivorella]